MFHQPASAFRPVETIARAPHSRATGPGPGAGGMLAATLVETSVGWRPAGRAVPGMRLQTLDGGLCPVARADRHWLAKGAALVRVPGGALDNCGELLLLPGQHLLITGPVVEAVLDASGALVPAGALIGLRGIGLCRTGRAVEMVTLGFARSETIFANTGALLHCQAADDRDSAYYPELTAAQADVLLALSAEGALSTADLRLAA